MQGEGSQKRRRRRTAERRLPERVDTVRHRIHTTQPREPERHAAKREERARQEEHRHEQKLHHHLHAFHGLLSSGDQDAEGRHHRGKEQHEPDDDDHLGQGEFHPDDRREEQHDHSLKHRDRCSAGHFSERDGRTGHGRHHDLFEEAELPIPDD